MSEEGEAGTGEAPPEGSQNGDGEGKAKKPGDNRIPLDRVKEMIATAVHKTREEFEARMETLKAEREVKGPKPPVEYTKGQLAAFVEAGQLTQDAADQAWENQIVERATRKATEAATNAFASGTLQRTIAEQMAEFQVLIPDAWEEGTPEREKVKKAYRSLTADGIKGSKDQLELAALKQAFGDPADIRKSRGLGRSGPAESFEDSGGNGSGRRGQDPGGDKDGPPKGLDSRQRAHYEKGIAAGRYKDWSAVREEMKFAKRA